MGTHYRKSPLPPKMHEISDDDDDDSFVLGIDSESEFSDASESSFEEGVHQPPQFEPKDPRSKAKYNIFSRLLFLLVNSTIVHDKDSYCGVATSREN